MSHAGNQILKYLRPGRLLTPVLIGLGVGLLLFIYNFDAEAFQNVDFTLNSILWIVLAVFMIVVRDGSYMIRIRTLTDNQLNWKQSFEVIMLWEFASAVIPPSVGGGFAVAIYLLNRERIELGKSIAVILFSSLLDGIFLGVMAPVAFFLAGGEKIFTDLNLQLPGFLSFFINERSISITFWLVYAVLLFYKLVVAYALFVNAKAVKNLLAFIFRLPIIRRWRKKAIQTGNEMIIASVELKGKSLKYWLDATLATFASWTARFLIINFIIAAFSNNYIPHLVLYCKQVIIGIINIISPTPGGSGLAELMFSQFFKEELSGNLALASALALLWRLISYYPYLFVGAIVLPRWIKRVYSHPEEKSSHG